MRSSVWLAAASALLLAHCAPQELPSEEFSEPAPPKLRKTAAQSIGGTLAVNADGTFAAASDPDVDRVWIADLQKREVTGVALFRALDDPGVPVFVGPDRVAVVLRGADAVVSFSVFDPGFMTRRARVCHGPRGMAFDKSKRALIVGCSSGEVVLLDADDLSIRSRLQAEPDLRDVFVNRGTYFASHMRGGHLVRFTEDTPPGEQQVGLTERFPLPDGSFRTYEPGTLWRVRPLQNGGMAWLQQRSSPDPILLPKATTTTTSTTSCSSYGGCTTTTTTTTNGTPPPGIAGPLDSCQTFTQSVLYVQEPSGALYERRVPAAAPVDFAIDEGAGVAYVVPGDGSPAVLVHLSNMLAAGVATGCESSHVPVTGPAPTAVTVLPDGEPLFQSKSALYTPAGLRVVLPSVPRPDTSGRDLFATPAKGSGIACASCHPDGTEDGRVWNFDPIGPRRTPPLNGGVMASAPFHWDGDMKDFGTLMDQVFLLRMGADPKTAPRFAQVSDWLDGLPSRSPGFSPGEDRAAQTRGKQLFDGDAGCSTCHGDGTPIAEARDVGTGKAFQVPRLVNLATRSRFMHDGCATTLRDRFDPKCGGAAHGNVADLTDAQLDDLIAYLKTL